MLPCNGVPLTIKYLYSFIANHSLAAVKMDMCVYHIDTIVRVVEKPTSLQDLNLWLWKPQHHLLVELE